MQNTIAKDSLREYVKRNEVVFQAFGDLVEVANEAEMENREELLAYFDDASSVEVYPKGHKFIKDEFADLDGWATDDDVLFLFTEYRDTDLHVKQHTIENKLIVA